MSNDVIVKPVLVAIPTTAGTGSEVTEYAVVTDVKSGMKIPITSKVMLPDFITADTGIDTLTHAIESYVSQDANEFSDSYALQAINLIFENLIPSFKDGKDLVKREKLQIASCMAGIAFNNSSLGINHSIAHAIGSKFHLSHGKCNGILLPYVMEYNMKDEASMKRYAEISRHMGFAFEDDHIAAHALIQSVILLKKALNIPNNLITAGIDRNMVIEYMDYLTGSAMKDMCTAGNPVKPTEQDLRGLILRLI